MPASRFVWQHCSQLPRQGISYGVTVRGMDRENMIPPTHSRNGKELLSLGANWMGLREMSPAQDTV